MTQLCKDASWYIQKNWPFKHIQTLHHPPRLAAWKDGASATLLMAVFLLYVLWIYVLEYHSDVILKNPWLARQNAETLRSSGELQSNLTPPWKEFCSLKLPFHQRTTLGSIGEKSLGSKLHGSSSWAVLDQKSCLWGNEGIMTFLSMDFCILWITCSRKFHISILWHFGWPKHDFNVSM